MLHCEYNNLEQDHLVRIFYFIFMEFYFMSTNTQNTDTAKQSTETNVEESSILDSSIAFQKEMIKTVQEGMHQCIEWNLQLQKTTFDRAIHQRDTMQNIMKEQQDIWMDEGKKNMETTQNLMESVWAHQQEMINTTTKHMTSLFVW